jgi:hypothetical protein
MANQRKLHDNRTNLKSAAQRGAAREGHALLQGLVLCGRCGHRMHVQYSGPTRRAVYDCYPKIGAGACWNVPARAIDDAPAWRVARERGASTRPDRSLVDSWSGAPASWRLR